MKALWLALLLPTIAAAGPCATLVGSCEYYQCREQMRSCGNDGYFLGFGYRYCRRYFDESFAKLSSKGQDFLKSVSVCLQEQLESISLSSCDETKNRAIDTHPFCYESTGFCDLPIEDKFEIMFVAAHELEHARMRHAAAEILAHCGQR